MLLVFYQYRSTDSYTKILSSALKHCHWFCIASVVVKSIHNQTTFNVLADNEFRLNDPSTHAGHLRQYAPYILAETSEKVPSDICAERRFRSDFALARSDQNLHWAHFGWPGMQNLYKHRRFCSDCADAQADYESALGACFRRQIFSCWSSNILLN